MKVAQNSVLFLFLMWFLLGACGGDDNHEPWPSMEKGGTDELTPLGSFGGKGELVVTTGGKPPVKPAAPNGNNTADAGADSN
ncbi:MAG: hypothetical protein HUU55_23420 [Myxococcales bacterium]|nr:hypothetical protein [Myxococcales bacterium]